MDVPNDYLCPITLSLMIYPVLTTVGNTYERDAIESWLTKYKTDPKSNEIFESVALIPNRSLQVIIRDYISKNPQCTNDQFISAVKSGDLKAMLMESMKALHPLFAQHVAWTTYLLFVTGRL